ncbi:MAG: tetratricopeptide repeat protein [Candidatus Riflebacteria bacterium]|nr:tetratricopeptide repeat protein [Candidatus Riflebacteria bacterium]
MHILLPHSRCLLAAALVTLLVAPAVALADTAGLHNNAGLAFYYQGKDLQAYEEFVKSLELDPSQASPHYNLGRLLERQGKFNEALGQYRQALELDPAMEEALRAVERLQGQPAPAPGFPATTAPAASEEDQKKLAGELRAAFKAGDKAAARQRLQESLASHPEAVPVLLLAAEVDEQEGNIASAVSMLQKARAVSPASSEVATRLALLQYRAGLFDQATVEAERALDLNPSLPVPYRILGLVMLSKQKPVEANAYFLEAVRLDPKDEISKAQVGKLGRQLGLIHYNNGLFYFQEQDWAKAKEELEQALAGGNLTPEQSALAQQYLVIADFSAARVAQQIAKLQADRRNEAAGRVSKRITFPEAETSPNVWKQGSYVEYRGYIVATSSSGSGSEILVTREPNEILFREGAGGSGEFDQSFRTNTEMTNWFSIQTPRRLPVDARIRPTSRVRVQGQLGEPKFARNPYNLTFSKRPLPTIHATYLEIQREQREVRRSALSQQSDEEGRDSASRRNPLRTRFPTPEIDTSPGLSGPLKIDYLQYPPPKRRLTGS